MSVGYWMDAKGVDRMGTGLEVTKDEVRGVETAM